MLVKTLNNIIEGRRNNISDIFYKAEEGVYADTPTNRKLGRVGQRYDGKQEDKKVNSIQDSIKKFKDIFTEAYEKREGKFTVEQWHTFETLMSKLPNDQLEDLKGVKGLQYLVSKIQEKQNKITSDKTVIQKHFGSVMEEIHNAKMNSPHYDTWMSIS